MGANRLFKEIFTATIDIFQGHAIIKNVLEKET